ncbi:hypothetical protein H4R33_003875 [Dimargaris cristalligena]|nr:hypothetical protein H4R33_003875 [Dimargaris cristalligena]
MVSTRCFLAVACGLILTLLSSSPAAGVPVPVTTATTSLATDNSAGDATSQTSTKPVAVEDTLHAGMNGGPPDQSGGTTLFLSIMGSNFFKSTTF